MIRPAIPTVVIAILLTAHCEQIAQETAKRLIVWNVGQGQWVTWVQDKVCLHFDAGGERLVLPRTIALSTTPNQIL